MRRSKMLLALLIMSKSLLDAQYTCLFDVIPDGRWARLGQSIYLHFYYYPGAHYNESRDSTRFYHNKFIVWTEMSPEIQTLTRSYDTFPAININRSENRWPNNGMGTNIVSITAYHLKITFTSSRSFL